MRETLTIKDHFFFSNLAPQFKSNVFLFNFDFSFKFSFFFFNFDSQDTTFISHFTENFFKSWNQKENLTQVSFCTLSKTYYWINWICLSKNQQVFYLKKVEKFCSQKSKLHPFILKTTNVVEYFFLIYFANWLSNTQSSDNEV